MKHGIYKARKYYSVYVQNNYIGTFKTKLAARLKFNFAIETGIF